MSSPDPKNFLVEQKVIPADQASHSGELTKVDQMSLEQVIRENVDQLGHTGSHTLGIFVQLLTTGKVKFTLRSHVKRLELIDKAHLMSRGAAVATVESILAELRSGETHVGIPEFTQNIIVQAPKPTRNYL